MRKVIALVLLALTIVGLASPAQAVSGQLGNAAIDRDYSDAWWDFVAVDTNNPAPFDGYFTSINFYVETPGSVRFVVVDAAGDVTWVSDVVTASTVGATVATFAQPVGITAGSNLGVYSLGQGVVSFEYDPAASEAQFTVYASGAPTVGQTLVYEPVGNGHRWYSMNATIEASSPQICKDGAWEQYGYTNQGQCIASIVANQNSGK